MYHPSAQFRHHGGYSLGKLPYGKFLEYYHTNQIRYFAKHHGPGNARRVRNLVVAGMRLRAALSILCPPVRRMSRGQSFGLFSAAARRFSEAGTDAT